MSTTLKIIFALLSILIFSVSLDGGFFWDNVVFGYKMGNHLYEHGLFAFNFPDKFDPGHPSFLAFILACGWKIFGKTLFTSHLVLLPFVYGLFIQVHEFVKHYIQNTTPLFLGILFILLDPTLDAQLVLISPEVIQVFFSLLAINGILKNKPYLKIIGLFFLGIVTYRGMLLFSGIALFDFLRHLFIQEKTVKSFFRKQNILHYTISALPAILFVIWRLSVKGWLQTHPNSPWESLWHFVTLKEFLRNIIVLGHRYLDFGRIGVLIFLIVSFILKKKALLTSQNKELFLLAICSVIAIITVSLLAVNPFGHRYFIMSYIAFALLAFLILQTYSKNKKTFIYTILALILVSGNFWVYPKTVAQGWDASLAHMPYFNLRKQAIQYLDNNRISIQNTVTFFPAAGKIESVDLSGDTRTFENDFTGTEPFVLYSNVFNLEDKEYDLLEKNYILEKEFSKGQVHVQLLKLKD